MKLGDTSMLRVIVSSIKINMLKNQKSVKEFSSFCECFMVNRLSIHFEDDKTKAILFCPK